MKKILTAMISMLMMVALVGSAEARTPARHTTAGPTVSAKTRAARVATLRAEVPKLRHQAKALGHKSVSHRETARIKRLMKPAAGKAQAATAGTYYWYSLNYAGVVSVDRYYDPAFYIDSSGDYCWVIYDNFVVGGYRANVYYYEYLCVFGSSVWWYGASGWTQSDPGPTHGFGSYYG